MIVRYAVRMKNGSYMVQTIDDNNTNIIHITTSDNPIDADLLNSKEVAGRCGTVDDIKKTLKEFLIENSIFSSEELTK